MTPSNVTTANSAVGAYFSVTDILRTMPMDPTVAGSGASATVDQRNYGMALAAMSQEAMSLGMRTSSSGMVTATSSTGWSICAAPCTSGRRWATNCR